MIKKIVAFAACFALSLTILGCSSGGGSVPTSSVSAQSSSAQELSEAQKQELAAYLQAIKPLNDSVSASLEGLVDLMTARNYTEIDNRFMEVAQALSDADKVEVPEFCETFHYNTMQAARCMVVVLGDYSDMARNGLGNSAEEAEEADQYMEMATRFTNDANAELSRLTGLSQASTPQEATKSAIETVFGSPSIVNVKSGSGASVGTCAVFRAASSDCTEDNLNTWYQQYVKDSSDNWCVIVYTDNPNKGVYANFGMVEVNVGLELDTDGSYSEGDDSGATFYVYSDADGVLKLA